MTPEKKKLWLYGGGAAALTLLVYFLFFNKKAPKVLPKPLPAPQPNDVIDAPEYPDKVDNGYQDVSKPSMIVAAKSGTRLRKEPNTNSAIVKTFKAGDQFFVNEKKTMSDGDWYHLNNGTGWVRSDVVTIMNAGFGGGF